MIKVFLLNPNLENRARRIIESGFGTVSDWELLERLVEVARRDGLEVEFIRHEKDRDVVFDLDVMEAALEINAEVRPLDEGVSRATE